MTQQVYVAEKWFRNSSEEANVKVQSQLTTEKVAGALRQEKESLADKVKEAIQA